MKKIRIDKYVADSLGLSRKQARKIIYQSQISINGNVVKDIDFQVGGTDKVEHNGNKIEDATQYSFYILNKPKGYITADFDTRHKTVMDLLPASFQKAKIMPVGRLDLDTTGLLLLTNHGTLAHRLLSPKRFIIKTYVAKLDRAIVDSDIQRFAEGLDLNDFVSKPAKLYTSSISNMHAVVELSEGKFHQVKRMFSAVGIQVQELHRSHFATLSLDIEVGQYRKLSDDEVKELFALCQLQWEKC